MLDGHTNLKHALLVLNVVEQVHRSHLTTLELLKNHVTARELNGFTTFTKINWSFREFESIVFTDEEGNRIDAITLLDIKQTLLDEFREELKWTLLD